MTDHSGRVVGGSSGSAPESPPERYDSLSQLLHWAIGLSLVAMVAFGVYLESLPSGKGKVPLIQIHKSVGVVLALFLLWRLARRTLQGFLPALHDGGRAQQVTARLTHVLLLLLPLGLVGSGVLRSLAYGRPVKVFGLNFIPPLMEKNDALHAAASNAHGVLAWALVACVSLHGAAALWHHFVNEDETLRRMLPRTKKRSSSVRQESSP